MSDASTRIPRWAGAAIVAALAIGAWLGAWTRSSLEVRVAGGVFGGAAGGYLAVSLLDLAEHLRLEKQATGRYLAAQAVPPGETVNHLATVVVVLFMLLGPAPHAGHDTMALATLLAPAAFLALGWRDEIVYHRRRAERREDLLHTTAHLAAGTMLAAHLAVALLVRDGLR